MKKTTSKSEAALLLRVKAEELQKKKPAKPSAQLSEAETRKLIHELEVHQIELEMQNEELVLAKEKAELAADKHAALYDFAPSGYFTLSKDGEILELNLCGAQMLGKERTLFVNNTLGVSISDDTKATYNDFLAKAFKSQVKESCEVRLLSKNDAMVQVLLTGIASENGEQCFVTVVDISERKLSEDALREEHDRLEYVLSATGTGIDIIDDNFNLQFVNTSWQNKNGDPSGRKCYEYFNGLSEPCPNCGIPKALETKQVVITEEVLPRENNRPIEVRIIPFQNTKGQWMVAEVNIDITERKRAEENLKKSERRLRTAVEAILDSFIICRCMRDKNGDICDFIFEDVNHHAENMLQMKRDDIIGKRMCELLPINRTAGFFDKYMTVVKTNIPIEEEFYLPDTNVPAAWHYHQVVKCGDGIAISHRDITERKQAEKLLQASEQRFRTAMQHLPGTIWVTDKNLTFTLSQGAGLEKIGLKPDQVIGRSLYEFFGTKDSSHIAISSHLRSLSGETVTYEQAFNDMVFRTILNPLFGPDGEIKNVLGLSFDVTAEKNAFAEKEKMRNEVNKMQKLESLGLLAGGIAHDFNNLMGGIFGYIDMASEATKEVKATTYLSKAMNTIERARALTQQLLTFAKGGAPIQKIDHLFPFVEETARFALSGANVSCHFDVQQDLWACNFDKNQIGQVIDNIIINARQAMPVGGTIELTVRNITLSEKEHPLLAKGNYVKISVKDSGIGIPKELIANIFDPFFTTKAMGHGLGLATCYSIINRHGGCIDVESEPGKGSTFKVYLPASTEDVSSVNENAAKTHKGSGTFLVMDDEEVMRDTIGDMLETLGYTIISKENGKDAIDFFVSETKANRTFVGMIFDLTVPGGMGGKAAIEEIRKTNKDIPAFVASGYADDPVMKNPTEYGFMASICKPFRKSELSEMLNKYIRPKK